VDKLSKLYELILEGLYSDKNIVSEEEKEIFLQNLQFDVKKLRNSYKNSCVEANYKEKSTQAAYLLAYYPQYAEMTYSILEKHNFNKISLEHKVLKVCLFGAGAAPEIAALLDFLNNQKDLQVDSVFVYAYDINASNWEFSYNIIRQFIIPKIWSKHFKLLSFDLDLCIDNAFIPISDIISESHVLIFQNCLNELKKPNIVIQNLEYLVNKISNRSLLIIADLSKHKGNLDLKIEIENRIKKLDKNLFSFRSHSDGEIKISSQIPIPRIVLQNLLVGTNNLIPRKWVEFNFISICRQEVTSTLLDKISLESLQTYIKNLEVMQKENESLQASLFGLQQQVKDLQERLQISSPIVPEAAKNQQMANLSLERLEKSLAAVDLSLRESVRISKESIIAQTKFAQHKLEKRLWIAIWGASGLAIIAIVIAVVSFLKR
jgi:phage pi2 protein 07